MDQRATEVQLVLAGYPGWLTRELFPAADAAALGSTLHQLGRVSEEELWSLYAGATLFAFPSRHEGFGLPVLEAMSQGTVVVASDIPAIREVAGGAARLVPPGDVEAWAAAIEALLADDAARSELAVAGRERARRFDVATSVKGIRGVYGELLGR
jgi:alpha-1,3-rhamnosyl/mannosyltransferase